MNSMPSSLPACSEPSEATQPKRRAPGKRYEPPHASLKHARVVLQMFTEYFDSETRALEFMRAHAGIALTIPTLAVIEELALELQAVRRLTADHANGARQLSDLHGVDRRRIYKIFHRAKPDNAQHCKIIRVPRSVKYRRRV